MYILEYEKITIYEVESLHKELVGWSQDSNKLDLDMTNIQKIDFAGIQLLLSAHKSVTLNTHNISNNVRKSFELAGADSWLAGVKND